MFALGILIVLGLLQFSLIRPYYRDNKIEAIEEVASAIQTSIIENEAGSESAVSGAFQLAVNNNVCVLVFNEFGSIVYQADGLGASCLFSQEVQLGEERLVPNRSGSQMKTLLENQGGLVSEFIINTKSNQEMLLYGRKVEANLGNFYLYVNSPLEPIGSLIIFLQEQYLTYAVIILFASIVISLFISYRLSGPFVKMKSAADKLALAKYDEVKFEGSYFSEVDELAKTLNDATTQLSKVDELRKDLIANMSHDIKTPLTMIKAYAEMIRDISGSIQEKREEHLDVIVKEVDYMDHLVNDMQELSRMQSDNYQLNRENFDIVEKVTDVIAAFKILTEDSNIQIVLDSEPSIIAYGDSHKIGQVIYNFVSNAVKHSEENKEIRIRITKKEEIVHFEIQDYAGGIPADQLPYIWDRYYRIDKTFRRSTLGTGLGLAIVRAILDNHQAKYGVDSVEGSGSLFWFDLGSTAAFIEKKIDSRG